MQLVKNVHHGLPLPEPEVHRVSLVRGDYLYYHYGCDGTDDRGWGCGYRTLQTMCSWVGLRKAAGVVQGGAGGGPREVPSLRQVQETLAELEDKPGAFVGSRTWIGSFEVALCLDKLYDVPCKLVHVRSGADLWLNVEELYGHFETLGSPLMMGGDGDNMSKGILGLCSGSDYHYLLVLDPHYFGKPLTKELAHKRRWVEWKKLELFNQTSFYNLCLPQCEGV